MNLIEVVVGWFLGLLSQPILERLQLKSKQREVVISLLVELREFRYTIAYVAHRLIDWNTISDDEVQLLRDAYGKYKSAAPETKDVETWLRLTAAPVSELKAGWARIQQGKTAPRLVRYTLPTVDVHAGAMQAFPEPLSRMLGKIRFDLDIFNQSADFIEWALKKTFDAQLGGVNRDILANNLKQAQEAAGKRCLRMVRWIDEFERLALEYYGELAMPTFGALPSSEEPPLPQEK